MCEWGTETIMQVTVPAHLSRTGKEREKVIGVDSCIAPIIVSLNAIGVVTVASCCGHGKRPGNIALDDGRELIIAPDFRTGRYIDAAFPAIFEERPVTKSATFDVGFYRSLLERRPPTTAIHELELGLGFALDEIERLQAKLQRYNVALADVVLADIENDEVPA